MHSSPRWDLSDPWCFLSPLPHPACQGICRPNSGFEKLLDILACYDEARLSQFFKLWKNCLKLLKNCPFLSFPKCNFSWSYVVTHWNMDVYLLEHWRRGERESERYDWKWTIFDGGLITVTGLFYLETLLIYKCVIQQPRKSLMIGPLQAYATHFTKNNCL